MSHLYQTAYKYRFDDTGKDPANRIADEDHAIMAGKHSIPFTLREGVFYTDDVAIQKEDGSYMGPSDYHFVGIEAEVTGRTGLSTAGGIVIDDTSYVGNVQVTYQCVGGPEGTASSMIKSLNEAIILAINNPTINFNQIEGLPATYPPALHGHHPKDLEDLDLIKQAFEDLTNALVNTRPLGTASLNFQEQIDRLLRLLGHQANRLNSISQIIGSGARLAAIEEKLNRDETIPDYIKGDYLPHEPAIVEEWDPTLVNVITGSYVFKGDDGTFEHAAFAILNDGISPKTTAWADMRSDDTLEPFLTIDSAIVGGKLQVSARAIKAGGVKLKWNSVL